MKGIEILAPAGSVESIYAALKLGADAVYTGTSRFGARAFADNPTVEEIREALLYAHLRQKKIYLTVNTLLTDKELEQELSPMIAPLYEEGLDACIVQDLGVLSFLHDNFPEMDLHASTQMTLLAAEEAELYREFGVTRFVPARECTIAEIRDMRKKTDMEIEVFVHGALCYCYSGQCLMSEVIGGRSGNRGMCAQPCRLPFDSAYGSGHLFSTKDSCTLLYIPELVEAGVDSFKIEGRMKKKEYSAYLSSLYRHYVDVYCTDGADAYHALKEKPDSELWRDIRRSSELYNRGGFSGGYLFEQNKADVMYIGKNGHYGTPVGTVVKAGNGRASFRTMESLHYQDVLEFRLQDDTKAYEYTVKNGAEKGELVTCNIKKGSAVFPEQMVYRTRNAALLERVNRELVRVDDRLPLEGMFRGERRQPVTFTVSGKGCEVTVTGPVLQEAVNRPVTAQDIENRLNKMGNTCYRWNALDIQFPQDSFLPLGEIGKLRRKAICEWEKEAAFRREKRDEIRWRESKVSVWGGPSLVSVANREQLEEVLCTSQEDVLLHIKLGNFPWMEWDRLPELLGMRPVALSFPVILRGEGYMHFLEIWRQADLGHRLSVAAVLINSHRSLLLARADLPEAIRIADDNFYHSNRRAEEVLENFGIVPSVPVVYGRKAVMVTEGCLKRTMGHCDGKEEHQSVKSSRKDEFIVVNHCDSCYNTIYTKEVCEKDVQDSCVRLDFTWESARDVRKVMRKWSLL